MAAPRMIEIEGARLETFQAGPEAAALVVCAAHPAEAFVGGTAALLAEIAETRAVCVNPRGIGGSTPAGTSAPSMAQTIDDLEAVRRALGGSRWLFWGMSGGGWLALLYAHRHPEALAGIVVESGCACFRERLTDPACVLSPRFPAWQGALGARGLLGGDGAQASPGETEWIDVEGVGRVLRRRGGAAVLVSPVAVGRDLERAMPTLLAFDARAWLGEVRTPTLVIAGDDDPVAPLSRVRAVHEAIGGSTFVVAEGGGHVPSAKRHPAAIAAVRAFVAERGRTGTSWANR